MRVTRIELRDFRNYEAAEVDLRGRASPSWPARTAPARPTCSRPSTSAAPRASPRTSNERELVRRGGDGVARVVLDLTGDDGEHRHRGRLPARRGEAPARRRQPRGQPVGRRRASTRERLPPGAARARQGRARGPPRSSRPGRRRALAEPRGDAQRLLARARAAQRPAWRGSGPGLAGPAALDAWDAELARARDRADGGSRGGRRRPPAAVQPTSPRSSACPARPSCATGRAPTASRRRRARRRAGGAPPGGPRARLHRPRSAPRRAPAAARRRRRCARTARRGSSGPRCSRSCSPSARCWPTAAPARR